MKKLLNTSTSILYKLLILLVMLACEKDNNESVNSRTTDSEDPYTLIKFKNDFKISDAFMQNQFETLVKTYNYAVLQWKYREALKLNDLNIVFVVSNTNQTNVDGVYMLVRPNNNYKGPKSDVFKLNTAFENNAKLIRVKDEEFVKKVVDEKIKQNTYAYYLYEEDTEKYVVFFIAKSNTIEEEIQIALINNEVGYYLHECFHLYGQRLMKSPEDKHAHLRFNLPDDYPVSSTSLTLMAAALKIYEQVYYKKKTEWGKYAKIQYYILNKLLELDKSGKDYVEGFFFYYLWAEGAAEFVEKDIFVKSGVWNEDTMGLMFSYESNILGAIEQVLEKEIKTSIINGEAVKVKYDEIDLWAYYIGASCLYTASELGIDAMALVKQGKTPYDILKKYIEDNQIVVDEEEMMNEIKKMIDWEATEILMQKYIDFWEAD